MDTVEAQLYYRYKLIEAVCVYARDSDMWAERCELNRMFRDHVNACLAYLNVAAPEPEVGPHECFLQQPGDP